jgi:hypothetical protein
MTVFVASNDILSVDTIKKDLETAKKAEQP